MVFSNYIRSLLLAGSSVIILSACGGGGGSSGGGGVVTPPPPPPPPPPAQATTVDVSIQGLTGYWGDEINDLLASGATRVIDNGLDFKFDVTGDGLFTVNVSGNCTTNQGEYDKSVSLTFSASEQGDVTCDFIISSNNGELWKTTLFWADAVNPGFGYDAMSIASPEWQSENPSEIEPNGYCPALSADQLFTYAEGNGSANNTVVYTSTRIQYTSYTDEFGNTSIICQADIASKTNDSSEERQIFMIPYAETVIYQDGTVTTGGPGASFTGFAKPTVVTVGQEYGNTSDIGQFGFGNIDAGFGANSVGGRSNGDTSFKLSKVSGQFSTPIGNVDDARVTEAFLGFAVASGGKLGQHDIVFANRPDGSTRIVFIGKD